MKAVNWLMILSCIALTASCSGGDSGDTANNRREKQKTGAIDKLGMIDPDLELYREDYRHPQRAKSGDAATAAAEIEPPIPDLAEVLAAPHPPKLGETKLVSIAVTDDVPLKDVFIELARMAEVDIELDSGITGGVSFRAKDRPFNEVIDRLVDLAGLRYSTKNGVLRIERDTPYVEDYPINFLNMDRTSNGSFNMSSTAGGGGGGGGGSGGGGSGGTTTSGSSAAMTSKSDSDFWKQFELGLKNILAYSEPKRISETVIAKQPGATDAPVSASGAAGAAAAAASQVKPAPAAAAGADATKSFYIINRQASTLTVSATAKQHDMIKRFVKMIESNTSSQVLIEAEVLEVDLNETFQSGIDWTKFGTGHESFTGNFDTVNPVTGIGAPGINILENNLINHGVDLRATINFLDEFGTVRTLSSPRLHAMNNQQAVLSFSEGLVYFNVKITTTDAVLGTNSQVVTPAQVNVTSTQQTAPVGVSLILQPVVDARTDEITLGIHPTLTNLVKYVNDPGFEISKAQAVAQLAQSSAGSGSITKLEGVNSPIPEIETRELDSIVKIKSGQALVIGGLIQNSSNNTDAGVPGADSVPIFGRLFQSVNRTNVKKELVIFLRATVVGPASMPTRQDKALYDKFGDDERPLVSH